MSFSQHQVRQYLRHVVEALRHFGDLRNGEDLTPLVLLQIHRSDHFFETAAWLASVIGYSLSLVFEEMLRAFAKLMKFSADMSSARPDSRSTHPTMPCSLSMKENHMHMQPNTISSILVMNPAVKLFPITTFIPHQAVLSRVEREL